VPGFVADIRQRYERWRGFEEQIGAGSDVFALTEQGRRARTRRPAERGEGCSTSWTSGVRCGEVLATSGLPSLHACETFLACSPIG